MAVDARQILSVFKPELVTGDGPCKWQDFAHTAWIAVLLMGVRAILERTALSVLKARMRKDGNEKKAYAVFDNLYIVTWSLGTEVLAVYVTLYVNGNCTPWDTDACLTAWPNHPVHFLQKLYMILMFQFYMHEMLGAFVGLQRMKTDMVVHHFATMGLISTAYALNLNRYGIMWQALFDSSNPLLHAAKGLHAADIPKLEGVKWALFNSFALVFFLARVAAAPYSVLYPALTRSLSVLPRDWALFLMALMFIVCGMQWVWFSKIVMMAIGKGDEKDEEDRSPLKKKQ